MVYEDTQSFLEAAYELVDGRIRPYWSNKFRDICSRKESPCKWVDETFEKAFKDTLLTDLIFHRVQPCVNGFLREIIDQSYRDHNFSENRLNQLWLSDVAIEKWANKLKLTIEESSQLLSTTQNVFLENLFSNDPVKISTEGKFYFISTTDKGLSVISNN